MKKILLTLFTLISIHTAFAQCEVFATTANPNFDCNDSVIIDLVGYSQVFTTDTFSFGGPTSGAWTATAGAEYGTPYLPSNQGGAYFWMGPSATVPTALTTTPFDLTGISNGEICFEMVYANGTDGMHANGTTPEQPDQYDEGVALQFNIGSGWQDTVYFAPQGDTIWGLGTPTSTTPGTGGPGAYEVWTEFCIPIPTGAIGNASVQFQWIQENNSGACCDHWGLDDVYIVASDLTYELFSLNNNDQIGPSPNTYTVTPTTDTTFVFMYTNAVNGGSNFCYDTIDLFVNDTDAGPDLQVSCSTLGIPLSVDGVSPWSNVTWSPAGGLNNPNIQTPIANPTTDQMYTVTSDCGVDSTFVNVVPIFTPSITVTEDSICDGDFTTLTANSNQGGGYTYEWTPTTVSFDTAMTTDAFPTINTTYYLEMVSDSGCVRNDSVQIYVGAVPKTINYTGEMRVCRGDSTQITVLPVQPTFFDDFESGTANPSIWDTTYNALANSDCGSPFAGSTNTLHFNGAGARGVQTFPLDASLGGSLSFWLIYGSTFGTGPCEDVSFNAEMQLEYSINGGTTWTLIRNYENFQHDVWALQTDTIPIGAQTTSTIFRLNQPNNGGNDQDNWAIDDFLMELNCSGTGCVQYEYAWTPTSNVTDPTIPNPFFFPTTSTWYSVAISPEGFNCNAAADSILIEVDELDLVITPTDTFLCEPSPVALDAEIQGFSNSCDGEYILDQVPFNYLTSTTPTNVSLGDDQVSAQVTIPFDFEFFCEINTTFGISSNGFINLSGNTDNGCCSGENLPTNNAFNPNDVIALMWSDLNPNNGGTISHFVDGVAPNRVQVIEFDNIAHFGASGATVSGQIQLFETTNIVEIHCLNCQSDGGIITQGIENSAGDVGYTPPGYNAADWSSSNEAWRYVPSNSPANFSFNWTPNTNMNNDSVNNPIVTPTSSTTYTFNVLNINNCLFQDSAEVNIYESNTTLTNNVTACFGDSIQLEATGADEYAWTSSNTNNTLNDTSISNPMSGTNTTTWYYVEYNTQGCIEEDSMRVTILNLSAPIINNGINPVTFCEGTTAELQTTALNGYTYSWNGPETGTGNTLSVTTPGSYTVEYFDGNCTNQTGVVVAEQPTPILDFASYDKNLCCDDDSIVIDFATMVTNQSPSEIDEIYWNGMEVTGNSYTYYSENDNFTQLDAILVRSVYGCEGEGILEIETNCVNPSFTNPDTVFVNTLSEFDLSTFDSGADELTYAWSTTEPGSEAIVANTVEDAIFTGVTEGLYEASVDVTATYGSKVCVESATSKNYEVVILADPVYPDAFSPNADGLNDVYRPIINVLSEMKEMRVYNRWGDLVYNMSTAENKSGWNGKYLAKDQAPGLYTYFIKILSPDGREFLQEGQVNLIR